MAMYGFLMPVQILFHIQPRDTGYLQTLDGPGCLITAGAGRHFITVAGIWIIIMDGSGYRIINGARHGFRGEELTDIMDGLLCNRELVSQSVLAEVMTTVMTIGPS